MRYRFTAQTSATMIAAFAELGTAVAETSDADKLKETIADVTALSLLCMEWSVNGEKVGALYTDAGFDIATSHEIYLITKDKMAEYKKVQADATASCIDLQAKYGPNGTIMPDMIVPKGDPKALN